MGCKRTLVEDDLSFLNLALTAVKVDLVKLAFRQDGGSARLVLAIAAAVLRIN